MVSQEEIKEISHSDPETIAASITALVKKMEELEARIHELEAINKELERQRGQNSQNSSLPPSRDMFRKPANHRKSGGKMGGPKGHKGHTLSLVGNPDEIIMHRCTDLP